MNLARLLPSPLRHALTALVLTGAWQPGLLAAASSSASYSITADSVDSGGLHASSAAYANDASVGGVTGSSSVATVTVKSGYIAQLTGDSPAFTTQPADQTVTMGANVIITSAASGSPTPTYQWQKGGVNISGATNSSLTFNNVQLGATGTYRVVATNSEGTATSSTATLTVNAAPALTTQPVNASGSIGETVTLTAGASGTPAPTYQWRKNGVNIAGATNSTLTLVNLQSSDTGVYSVVATNLVTSVTSSGAVVYVSNPTGHLANFNGDSRADLLWRNANTGDYDITLLNGATSLGGAAYGVGGGWEVQYVADFNGDGKTDLLWRNSVTGGVVIWFMDGTTIVSSTWIYDSGLTWVPAHVADFNGDGTADILWQNTVTGEYAFWLMSGGSAVAASGFSVAPGWGIYQIADFDGDGKADILWRNNASGGVVLWLMNGMAIKSSPWIYDSGTAWTPARIADFNGDGKQDILWSNSVTGEYAIWLMNGSTVIGATAFSIAPGWSVYAGSDFNGDGKTDLLLRNGTAGGVVLWLMNGTTIASSSWLYDSGPAWSPARIGDFNGDGKADILWRNADTGAYALWLMNGSTTLSAGSFTAAPGDLPFVTP